MMKLSEFIHEALKPIKLSDAFDIVGSYHGGMRLFIPSSDIDNEKALKHISGDCSWDDKEFTFVTRYGGSCKNNPYFVNCLEGPHGGVVGTLKNIGESDEDPQRTANMLRVIGRIEIKNPNSVRSIVSSITKTLKELSVSNGKEIQIYSRSKNDDDEYSIRIDMKWGRDWMENITFSLLRK